MKTSAQGLMLIENFEGLKLKAYQDGNGVWTIGYGHTSGVKPGQYETQQAAQADLVKDVAEAESAITGLITVQLTQGQFDALVSFTYNEGIGRLKASNLLLLVNAKRYALAALQFTRWDIVAGKVSEGLLRRRIAEQHLFMTGQY